MVKNTGNEIFAVNLAALAREIAMDVLEIPQILQIHQLSDREWTKIQANPQFDAMLKSMIADWQSAANVRERVRMKSATGLESHLDQLITELADTEIPLAQRIEAAKFIARLGELETREGPGGPGFHVTLNIGGTRREVEVSPKLIEGAANAD
jgi:hypothetical protein